MKVKELLSLLAQADQELDVAVMTGESEYWGYLYGVADFAQEGSVDIDGPKKPSRTAFVIKG